MCTKLNVVLLQYPTSPEKLAALAAKMCYSSSSMNKLQEKVDNEDNSEFLNNVIKSKHLSVAEHANFTFGIEGVSRVLLAQLTRHRIASFSVRSQRVINELNFEYVIPETIKNLSNLESDIFIQDMLTIRSMYEYWYNRLISNGFSPKEAKEDARYVLPGACETKLILTMNARELLHFFSLRCCNRSQWEIRSLAWEMLKLVREVAPNLFKNAGPPCIMESCAEGKHSCGKPYKLT